ncbi:MAG: zinc ABC transporter substrate-binding protein [Cognatishimia sp.]|uniref:metal ABC transporter solute-binding protein, Zn/Mn family n=1 Tax=Cognatishimia sp. TaxID=2211648 RepID=UPI003B8B2D61
MRFSRRLFMTVAAAVIAAPVYAAEKLSVVATTGMIADAARQVGGELVDVRGLMGPGVDPHAYRQTRTDIVAMTRADLVLWHGLYLEAQMEDFFHDLGAKRRVVAVAEGLPKEVLKGHDDYADKFDPHVWMDPELWSLVVAEVRDSLIELQPESQVVFEANAAAHLAEIAKLSGYSSKAMATVPAEARVLLTAHDAFGYFGSAYGFEVLGIQGISTQSEAGLNRISTLVDMLVDRQVSAIFVESSVSDRNIRALIEGAAAKGHEIKIGGELFSDAMGIEGTYEGTYVGMIDHNVTVIADALGGDVPMRGMQNKLSAGS